ncbi:PepSY-associated TM helix domain-containing protein [Corynebacterium sanguinis]|uniref:PepSY-associated TM helix domain-containing protein n=1 Tax=Corynebacterium sanguinis TaxID=2594913 RepID=UPI002882E105|nr:PepSY-associated TM helix domain-containing protein [Corynebacterium sanguinis]
MHKNLHIGEPGRLYAELAASWLWVVALGGLFLWWRVTRTRVLTGLEKRTSRRGRVVNLHGVVGTWLLVGTLGLSVTGVTWSVLAGENVGKTAEWIGAKAEPIETEIDRPGEKLSPAEVADQAAVVLDTATAQGLTGQLRLFVPKDGSHAWQASERWVPWRVTSDAVSVDALPLSELPLFSKLMSWGIYLHMGIMFGLPLQIALALLALGICAMTVMGYVMWWRRRPSHTGVAGVPGRTRLTRTDWVIVAIFGVAVGLFLPLFGLSFAAMRVADRLLAARAAQRSAWSA